MHLGAHNNKITSFDIPVVNNFKYLGVYISSSI